ncbi:ABC-type transport system involved in cytochrome bd biosynthesis, ATPase and permease components [Pseudobutyrivibrio sp. OR37]|uniref:ABC transporter ATP-binding protein/permease n=1 Tax=Pseudobutyrivibrio sp. OR37 TaxID=1798186 RepID=UPI0008EB50A0|nr:ABC transporter ATP-binding protein/permease [Pseudobutyrivibrio sp. OR37]SFI23809.1 ABC-type transport system involved in cytochrome bd biosynthesis, ATPase and permease components [Pseudobutyrivibrio sp. OR37]
MIKTRLLRMLKNGTRYVVLQVVWQWLGLIAQIIIVGCIARTLSGAYYHKLTTKQLLIYIGVVLFSVVARIIFDRLYTEASFEASVDVKSVIREKIYSKLLRLGSGYRKYVSSAQITQMMGEGVEQLEVYFGKYISQFVYALLAPFTLFLFLFQYNIKVSLVLLVAVPLIPMVIMIVMKVARKLLDKYFKIYYGLGDTFLEKLHGMTTLKIYGADGQAADEMDEESENFRRITMKVLSMQLNSTIIMDVIAYAGAAVGIGVTLNEFAAGGMKLSEAIMFLLLSAEFFLPMRLLGSYFHIGMNGMKAADKIFDFLDIKEPAHGKVVLDGKSYDIALRNTAFSYDKERVLDNININIPTGKLISIVGVSGSGKSTIAGILRRQFKGYEGSITIGGRELKDINEDSLMSAITAVSYNSFIFPGTVRDNLLLGNGKCSDKKLTNALKIMNLLEELKPLGGLDLQLKEGGSNLSGGQRQRLALARALLKNSPIYIFDESTSNIDVESEEIIMKVIRKLSKDMGKTIILISHRLANVVSSDSIFMLEAGNIVEQGTHSQLMVNKGSYAKLFTAQHRLENYAGGES